MDNKDNNGNNIDNNIDEENIKEVDVSEFADETTEETSDKENNGSTESIAATVKKESFFASHKKQIIAGGIGMAALAVVGVVLALNGNKEKVEESTTALITTAQTTTEEITTEEQSTEVNHDNDTISKLTGDWIPKKVAKNRPIAIMINNISDAIPQAGISNASIIHECPVEGGMTRLMALFEDTKDIERIGSIRSCRLYYCFISNEYDAIYTHFGQSKYAKDYLDSDQIDNISGLSAVGNYTFYRASDKYSPHDVYTDHDKLEDAIKTLGYERKYDKEYKGKYKFADVDGEKVEIKGDEAYKVSIGYPINAPWFEYDEETGLYKRFQYGGKHIDENNKEQLQFTNLICQYVDYTLYDDGKSLDMTVTGSGEGYYITNGKCQKITWEKDELSDITKYYNPKGKEIKLNVGKTYVAYLGKQMSVTLTDKETFDKSKEKKSKKKKKAETETVTNE